MAAKGNQFKTSCPGDVIEKLAAPGGGQAIVFCSPKYKGGLVEFFQPIDHAHGVAGAAGA